MKKNVVKIKDTKDQKSIESPKRTDPLYERACALVQKKEIAEACRLFDDYHEPDKNQYAKILYDFSVVLEKSFQSRQSRNFLEKSAQSGHPEAAFQLVELSLSKKVPAGLEVLKWCQMAAENGHAEAAYRLGILFSEGQVSWPPTWLLKNRINFKTSLDWFARAKTLEHPRAAEGLERLQRRNVAATTLQRFFKSIPQQVKEKKLTPEQKEYVGLGFKKISVFKFTPIQLDGILAGLSRQQVCHRNFGPHITTAVKAGFDYQKLIDFELKYCQTFLEKKKFQYFIETSSNIYWRSTHNNFLTLNPLKFHIGIDYSEWKKVKNKIIAVLNKYVNNGTIEGYKYRQSSGKNPDDFMNDVITAQENYEIIQSILIEAKASGNSTVRLKKPEATLVKKFLKIENRSRNFTISQLEIANNAAEHKLRTELRYCHNPITVYLPNTKNYDGIILFCRAVEEVLSKTKPANANTLAQEDVSLYPHISIRKNYTADGASIRPSFLPSDEKQPHSTGSPSPAYLDLQQNSLFKALIKDAKNHQRETAPAQDNPSCCVIC